MDVENGASLKMALMEGLPPRESGADPEMTLIRNRRQSEDGADTNGNGYRSGLNADPKMRPTRRDATGYEGEGYYEGGRRRNQ